jgi:hypothetical protein
LGHHVRIALLAYSTPEHDVVAPSDFEAGCLVHESNDKLMAFFVQERLGHLHGFLERVRRKNGFETVAAFQGRCRLEEKVRDNRAGSVKRKEFEAGFRRADGDGQESGFGTSAKRPVEKGGASGVHLNVHFSFPIRMIRKEQVGRAIRAGKI